jgi:hypothetical protein
MPVSARLTVQPLLRLFALLAIAAALLAAFPQRPVGAQNRPEIQTLDNTQVQFANGAFQRVSLSSDRDPTIAGDLEGAVQLAPAGTLQPWERSAVGLPVRNDLNDDGTRSDAAVVSIGNRLIVIGGGNGQGRTNTVLYATVDQILGSIAPHGVPNTDGRFRDENWLNVNLPAVQHIPGCDPESSISGASAAAIANGENSGFIYVVGGSLNANGGSGQCGPDLTSSAVQVLAVTPAGITPVAGPAGFSRFPSEDFGLVQPFRGAQNTGVAIVQLSSDRAYLYVTGGLSAFYDDQNGFFASQPEQTAFYIQINPATGAFVGDWQAAAPIPLPPDPTPGDFYGIFGHATISVSSAETTAAGPVIRRGIAVAGGLTRDPVNGRELNPFVYRATVNESSGDLIWDATPSIDDQQVPFVQEGAAGIAYNNKLYLIGGAPATSTSPVQWVQTANFDDNLLLRNFADGGSPEYFVGRDSTVLPEARSFSGATVIDALPPVDNPVSDLGTAWAFVVGGNDATDTSTSSIFRGRIGGAEAEANIRTNEGWYFSRVFSVAYQAPGQAARDARILSIQWAADINRSVNTNADMVVQFRRTRIADPTCANESVFNSSDPTNAWITLPRNANGFFSQDDNNVVSLESLGAELFNATCFQYRVRFLQNGVNGADDNGVGGVAAIGGDRSATPRLLRMAVERVPIGNPDIRAKQFEVITFTGAPEDSPLRNKFAGLSVTLQNLVVEDPIATQNALVRGQGGSSVEGSFYVHLCIANETKGEQLNLPTLPVANPATLPCAKAYYEVYTWQMTAGAELRLENRAGTNGITPFTQTWRNPQTDAEIRDLADLFREPGTYRIALLIDTIDSVNEGAAGEANNLVQNLNNGQPLILTVEGPPVTLLRLPLMRR